MIIPRIKYEEGPPGPFLFEILGGGTMKLSVAMIVRDEENNIRRAFDSVLPIADEIVILDTGSVDNTKAIITAYEDPKIRLSDHPWQNDFSEARNASI